MQSSRAEGPAAFDGGAVTSNGGGALLREADRAIGLTRQVARCFRDERNPDRVVHSMETLVAQRVHAIALGYEDINDHDELRHDPVLGLLSDTLEPRGRRGHAGRQIHAQPAGARPEERSRPLSQDQRDRCSDEKVFLALYVGAKNPPKRIILDLDATDDPLHGDQEGRFYHGYYRCYCYLPLYIFDGRHLLVAKLRQADRDASAGAKEEIALSWRTCGRRGPRSRSGCGRTRASPATN